MTLKMVAEKNRGIGMLESPQRRDGRRSQETDQEASFVTEIRANRGRTRKTRIRKGWHLMIFGGSS